MEYKWGITCAWIVDDFSDLLLIQCKRLCEKIIGDGVEISLVTIQTYWKNENEELPWLNHASN